MQLDPVTAKATDRVLADLRTKGGGTYEAATLLPSEPPSGYAVGIGGLRLPQADVTPESVLWACKAAATEYETPHVGLWLGEDGLVYFDAVRLFDRLDHALAEGRKYGQQAIFDFAANAAIML